MCGLCGEVLFKDGVPEGYTRQGFFDTAYTSLEVEDESTEEDCFVFEEDETEEMYITCDTEGSQYTAVGKFLMFMLCVVICLVIACVCSIIKL